MEVKFNFNLDGFVNCTFDNMYDEDCHLVATSKDSKKLFDWSAEFNVESTRRTILQVQTPLNAITSNAKLFISNAIQGVSMIQDNNHVWTVDDIYCAGMDSIDFLMKIDVSIPRAFDIGSFMSPSVADLFVAGRYTDVTLLAKGQPFKCLKGLLMEKSQYFEALVSIGPSFFENTLDNQ